MSERLSLQDILRDYGVPLMKLDVTASTEECTKLRQHLKEQTQEQKQAYLEVNCSFFIDIHDLDRYLTGELNNLGEIFVFPEDVKIHQEE